MKAYIFKCDVCLANQDTPRREPLIKHEFVARPWSKVIVDQCEFAQSTLLVIADYYSNFFKVSRITGMAIRSVINTMKEVFACYGILDVVVSDISPQFAKMELTAFCKDMELCSQTQQLIKNNTVHLKTGVTMIHSWKPKRGFTVEDGVR